jgi:aspartyl-tRNA(Asn)/glutamyl-tRNA(Gln) amidotransferase subunit A
VSALTLAAAVRAGERSAVSVVTEALARAEAAAGLGAFLHLQAERALADAQAVDALVVAGRDPGPLAGVPVALKDNIADAGEPLGCASRMLEGYRAPYTATAVSRLRAAGAVPIGRTNMDEFAMGSSTENSAYFPAKNPWDPSRVPGGSSGGSAVAVAAQVCPIALGSETGGSVRQPASLCGVVGLKPTYGRISRSGLVAFASSTDQLGPFGSTVRDCALLTEVISGVDPRDGTTARLDPAGLLAACERPVAGLRIGLPVECWGEGIEPGVRAAVEAAVEALRAQGARVQAVSVPSLPLAIAVYQVVTGAEASSNLARFDGVRYGPREEADELAELYIRTRSARFGAEVQRRILLGTFVLSAGYAEAYYQRAQGVRERMSAELDAVFTRVDALLTPTSPTVAFRLGERMTDPLSMYLSDIFTAPASLTGHVALSVPAGLSEGLPVGAQLWARRFEEGTAFALAAAIEADRGLFSPRSSPGFISPRC